MLLAERYECAINAENLAISERTNLSPTDVLASAAFATKNRPLAAALMRWFAGDRKSLPEIGRLSVSMLTGKAWHSGKIVLRKPEAEEIVSTVLVWYWVNVCAACKGRGYVLIPGAPILSDIPCAACNGAGRLSINHKFGKHPRLAAWLAAEYEREHSFALSRMGVAIRAS